MSLPLLLMAIVDILSWPIMVGRSWGKPREDRNCRVHITDFVHSNSAIYSASVDESATSLDFLEYENAAAFGLPR